MAEPRRWFDPSQPQTMQGAVMFSYLTAAFSLLWILFGAYPLVISLGLGAAGYGVANEKRWGYWLGIVLAGLSALIYILVLLNGGPGGVAINLLFMGVLIALFLHPQSREYQRIWFK
jgi:H+/Cl- antiporter ClcA